MKKLFIFLLMMGVVTSALGMDVSPTAARPGMPEDLTKKNYFDILGVPYNAGTEQIRDAFKKLTFIWHPDQYKRSHTGASEQALKLAEENYKRIVNAKDDLENATTPISRIEPIVNSSVDVASALAGLERLREAYKGSSEFSDESLAPVASRKLFEKFKADVASYINNTKDSKGKNLLHQAVANNNLFKEIMYLDAGANPNATTDSGSTPLMIAANNGYTQLVEFLLKRVGDEKDPLKLHINKANNNGATALLVASQAGHKDIVNKLMAAGADINKSRNNGATPLVMAISQGHPEVAKLLIQSGADVNKSFQGQSSMQLAESKGMNEVVKLIQSKLPAPSPAAGATFGAASGPTSAAGAAAMPPSATSSAAPALPDMIRLRMNVYADPGAKNDLDQFLSLASKMFKDKNVPINTLITPEDIKYVKSRYESEINPSNLHGGKTRLIKAAIEGDIYKVKLLLAMGAYINIATNSGETALSVSILEGHPEIAKLLIQSGADLNTKFVGKSPLQLAQEKWMNEVVQLIQSKMSPAAPALPTMLRLMMNVYANPVNNDLDQFLSRILNKFKEGNLPLSTQISSADVEVPKDKYADQINQPKNYAGKTVTPLINAAGEGDIYKVKLLLAMGADINKQSPAEDGVTPLMAAVEKGHVDVVKELLGAGADRSIKSQGRTALDIARSKKTGLDLDSIINFRSIIKLLEGK